MGSTSILSTMPGSRHSIVLGKGNTHKSLVCKQLKVSWVNHLLNIIPVETTTPKRGETIIFLEKPKKPNQAKTGQLLMNENRR